MTSADGDSGRLVQRRATLTIVNAAVPTTITSPTRDTAGSTWLPRLGPSLACAGCRLARKLRARRASARGGQQRGDVWDRGLGRRWSEPLALELLSQEPLLKRTPHLRVTCPL